jgi:hypothetical protein
MGVSGSARRCPTTHTRVGVPIEQSLTEGQRRADRMLDETLAGCSERFPYFRMTRHAVYYADLVPILVDESRAAGIVVVGSRGGGGSSASGSGPLWTD